MTSTEHTKTSKFLSYILRHKPDAIGLTLDEQGWADIDQLIAKANASNRGIMLTRAFLQDIVDTSDKKRFVLSQDGKKIRAAQGHSIDINLQLKPIEPPELLYHGTASRFLDDIMKQGLNPQQRQYVHLSKEIETALAVGRRYGKPIVLTIKARAMYEQGFKFYLAENGVWLAEEIPAEFLNIEGF